MSIRNGCFTLHDYTEEDEKTLQSLDCNYIVFGREICPDTGRPHLQGYVEFKGSKRFTTLKKINERIHWENRKGTAKQASDYCKKDKDFYENGILSKQGKRTDIDVCAEMIVDNTPMADVARAMPATYVRYHKGLNALRYMIAEDRKEAPQVFWRWGKSGTGKTRYCVEKHESHYIKDGTPWWDGYENQEAIILDDFEGCWNYRDFLRLLDRYKYQGQVKGGYVKINSPYIYITCEYPPEHFWSGNALAQVLRRVADVAEVAGNTSAATLE